MNDEIVFEEAMTADEFVQHCKQTFSYLSEAIIAAADSGVNDGDFVRRMSAVRRSMMERYTKLTGRYLPTDAYPIGWEGYDVDR